MLPIDKLLFTERKFEQNFDTNVITGRLALSEDFFISAFARSHAKFDLVEYAKQQMRRKIWHRTYGELLPLFRELRSLALRDCTSQNFPRVRELCEELDKLLSYPTKEL